MKIMLQKCINNKSSIIIQIFKNVLLHISKLNKFPVIQCNFKISYNTVVIWRMRYYSNTINIHSGVTYCTKYLDFFLVSKINFILSQHILFHWLLVTFKIEYQFLLFLPMTEKTPEERDCKKELKLTLKLLVRDFLSQGQKQVIALLHALTNWIFSPWTHKTISHRGAYWITVDSSQYFKANHWKRCVPVIRVIPESHMQLFEQRTRSSNRQPAQPVLLPPLLRKKSNNVTNPLTSARWL